MLTIIHGDNIKESREYHFQLRQKYQAAKILEGDKVTLTDITEAIVGDGLFATTDAVLLDQVVGKKRASTELDGIIDFLNQKHDLDIFIWESKELDKKLLKKFTGATTKLFSYPQTLFQFLDSLRPNNSKQLITLFHETLQKTEVELLLFMLTKQVRMLLALRDDRNETISEVAYMQPWQKGKLQKQARFFSVEQLIAMHTQLFEFDLGYKTGRLPLPLTESLDFFLAMI